VLRARYELLQNLSLMGWKKSGIGIKDKHFVGLFFASKAKKERFLSNTLFSRN
jgi:hypothetical protein